jgi:putative ABC transport system permease protein
MIRNYFKVAFRNILKRKVYVAINIIGLALGLATAILVMLYVWDELSYDKFHQKADRIYRINSYSNLSGSDTKSPKTSPPVGAAFMKDLPEIEGFTIIGTPDPDIVRINDRFFAENKILTADSGFFQLFSFPLIEGDPRTALKDPFSVVLTEKTAKRYFGENNAVGQMLTIGNAAQAFRVTAVAKDIPSNSHFSFNVLTSITSYPELEEFEWSWVWNALTTYISLHKGTDAKALEKKLDGIASQYVPTTFEKIGVPYDQFKRSGGYWDYKLQPLGDLWLRSGEIGNGLGPVGDIRYVFVFITVALLVVLLSCINFVNLATARSVERAKEIGIRKILSSSNKQLTWLLLIESIIICFLAAIPAILLARLFVPYFNNITAKDLSLLPHWGKIVAFLVILPMVIGFIAGTYPAMYLTSLKPSQVLRGSLLTKRPGGFNLRNVLLILQFVISICLIISSLFINNQLSYIRNKDLGFNKENVLVISNAAKLEGGIDAFRQSMAARSDVKSVSVSSGLPSKPLFRELYTPSESEVQQMLLLSLVADENFIPSLGISMVKGRNFSKEFSTDNRAIILNEAAVKSLGWKEPIDKKLKLPDGTEFNVVGVMKDFNFVSLKEKITPFAIFHNSSNAETTKQRYVSIKMPAGKSQEVIKAVEAKWNELTGGKPLEYSYLDEDFDAYYAGDIKMGYLFNFFTAISILIACFGLLSLTSFMVEKRTKEIGMRKVLGASSGGILMLLQKDFAKLILLAFLIAVPISYLAMYYWLENFAYRINIGVLNFILAAIITFAIAGLTIALVSMKVANKSSVKTLRMD